MTSPRRSTSSSLLRAEPPAPPPSLVPGEAASPVFPTGGHVKGAPLAALLECWVRTSSRAVVLERIAALPSATRDELRLDLRAERFGILPASWYPVVAGVQLFDAIAAELRGPRFDDFIAESADFIIARALRGVHRAVFRVVGSPELLRRHGQTFWNRQFDTGRLAVIDVAPARQRHEYHSWDSHHPVLCRLAVGCIVPMFAAMGVRRPRVQVEHCVVDGPPGHCSAHVQWDE